MEPTCRTYGAIALLRSIQAATKNAGELVESSPAQPGMARDGSC
jgi:hypothetical protein